MTLIYYECPDCGFSYEGEMMVDGKDMTGHSCEKEGDFL